MRFKCRKCYVKHDGSFRPSCPACLAEYSLVPEGFRETKRAKVKPEAAATDNKAGFSEIEEIQPLEGPRSSTGIPAVDAVFGRNESGKYNGQTGIHHPSLVIFSGPKGLGKTALLYEIIAQFVRDGVRCAFVSAEQQPNAIRAAIIRIGLDSDLRKLKILHTKDFNVMMQNVNEAEIDVVVLDSINKIFDPNDPIRDDTKSRVNIVNKLLVDAWGDEKKPRTWICVSQMSSDLKVAGREELLHDVDVIALLHPENGYIVLECPEKNRFGRAGTKKARFRMNDVGKMVPIEELPSLPPRVESGALEPIPTTQVAAPVDISVTLAEPLVAPPAPSPDDIFEAPQTPIEDVKFDGLLARGEKRRIAREAKDKALLATISTAVSTAVAAAVTAAKPALSETKE